MNLTLIIILIVFCYMMVRGWKIGMTRQVSGLAALGAALAVLALGIMLVTSFENGEVVNTVYSVAFLVVFGLVYGIVKFLLRSVKMVVKLPLLHFCDKLLGIAAGAIQCLLLVWIFFLFFEHGLLGKYTEYVSGNIEESIVLKLLYQSNFFSGR